MIKVYLTQYDIIFSITYDKSIELADHAIKHGSWDLGKYGKILKRKPTNISFLASNYRCLDWKKDDWVDFLAKIKYFKKKLLKKLDK